MLVVGQGVVDWVAKRTDSSFVAAQGIGWQRDGELIAGTVYESYNGVNVMAHIASDGTRRWLTREYLFVLFDYPFNQLKVKRVTLTIGEGNSAARKFAVHLGFEFEAPLKSAHPTGDMMVYRMFSGSCKWIKAGSSKQYAQAA